MLTKLEMQNKISVTLDKVEQKRRGCNTDSRLDYLHSELSRLHTLVKITLVTT